MKAIVIGYGSIGSRHTKVLENMGLEVSSVSQRSDIVDIKSFKNIRQALKNDVPDYIVIANETSKHYASLAELAKLKFRGKVLVEKPLFDKYKNIPPHQFKEAYVGYNLRFNPLIQRLKKIFEKEKVISFSVYVGKYLPSWRLNADYRERYSAKKDSGGGVLRDLSHELDYLNLLLGGFKKITGRGGHFSNLNIETDDVFSVLAETEKCPLVNLEMNYLDRPGSRQLLINTNKHTYKADLFKNELYIDGKLLKNISLNYDYTYKMQHKAILSGKNKEKKMLCSLNKGLEIVKLIEAIETAAAKEAWVKL